MQSSVTGTIFSAGYKGEYKMFKFLSQVALIVGFKGGEDIILECVDY